MSSQNFNLRAIARIRSCYRQRFGIPRQPGLVSSAVAAIEFDATRNNELSLRDLESFSHLWVVFVFHQQKYQGFKPLVAPPRLGGKKTMGVYATRSPNRPNSIGLSAVRLDRVEPGDDLHRVYIRGGDFLDGTPVLDIKPYVPFADAVSDAVSDWALPVEDTLPVQWEGVALEQLESLEQVSDPVMTGTHGLKFLIEEILAQDPRPSHERGRDGRENQRWGVAVGVVDVRFKVERGVAVVSELRPVYHRHRKEFRQI